MFNRQLYQAFFVHIVQFYDYALFGLTAARLADYFFPTGSDEVKITNIFLVLAVSVVARPLGALMLGKIGDVKGRSELLKIASLGVAIPTFIIGLIPSHEAIGHLATFILVLCRLVVVSCMAGETDGVRLFVTEKLGKHKKFMANSLVISTSQIGVALAGFMAWFTGLDFLPDWSWKFCYYLGGLLGLILFFSRKNLQDSEIYKGFKQTPGYEIARNASMIEIIKHNTNIFILTLIMTGCIGASYHFHIIFMPTYLYKVIDLVDDDFMTFINFITILFYIIGALISGIYFDRYKDLKINKIAIIFLILISSLNAYHINYGIFKPLYHIMIGFLLPFISVPLQVLCKENINYAFRLRLFSFAHALGSVIISGTTPFLSTVIWRQYDIAFLPIIYFIAILSIIFILAFILKNQEEHQAS